MVYAALVSLAQKLDWTLDHRFCSSCDFSRSRTSDTECIMLRNKERIQRLHSNNVFLLTFVRDYPREAGKFEARLTDTANQTKGLLSVYPAHSSISFSEELEKLIVETDLIREEAMQIKTKRKNPRSSGDGNDTVVGMEEELLRIKNWLFVESSELQIIPIIGMGGIGKTTLARYAYDDPLNVHHFDVRVWVTISQSYHLKGILFSLLHSIKNAFEKVYKKSIEEDDWYWNEELLIEQVYRYLKGRRYLIVMDDMWDTNVWDDIQRMFPEDSNGSRIIITTRELNVASYINSLNQPHQMRLMNVDQSWSLLRAKVFGDENCPLELEKIGELIAEKCRGLPLAIVVIAGVLSKVNKRKESWEKIARNVSKAVDEEQIYDILSLSYMHLPSCSRPCFLYMGGFPEDYEINVSKLIRLCGAEGFLIPSGSKDMEEMGYEYLEDLVNRSLVLINKKSSDGKIRTVKIHDLLRDLCLRKAKEQNFLCSINEFSGSFPHGIENFHCLRICCNVFSCIPNMESSRIHTILLFQHWAFDFWKSFRRLMVVDALSVKITSSNSIRDIGELIYLRYLGITCEAIAKTLRLVSESLCHLQSLQTLLVRVERNLVERHSLDEAYVYQSYVKFEIWRIPQLRHLILLDGFLPDPSTGSFQEMSSLVNLHTLSRIEDFKCSERISEMMPNLKKLGIVYSYEGTYETGWSKYGLNNLVHLRELEKLSLYAEPYPNLKNDVSQNISFPVTLKKLTLSGCSFPWEDMKMIGSLPNLQVLKLMRSACHGTEWETSEEEFCQLKVLLIDTTDLHEWIVESSSFPRLERLTLYECNSLKEIPYGIGDIPTLQLIEVDIRNLSLVESAKCIEEEQQSCGNDLLQVRFLKYRSWPVLTSN